MKNDNLKSIFCRPFLLAILANFIWINASEIFRYFIFIMPMMRETFPQIDNVASMSVGIFLIWGIWDTILIFFSTLFFWLFLNQLGNGIKSAIFAGISVWSGVFLLLWLGLYNMNMASFEILKIALPLSLLEMVIAALIVRIIMVRNT